MPLRHYYDMHCASLSVFRISHIYFLRRECGGGRSEFGVTFYCKPFEGLMEIKFKDLQTTQTRRLRDSKQLNAAVRAVRALCEFDC